MIHKKCFWRFEIRQKQNKTKQKRKLLQLVTSSSSSSFLNIFVCDASDISSRVISLNQKQNSLLHLFKKSSLKQIQLKHVKNEQNVHDDSRVLRDSDETSADDSTAGKSDGLHERRQTSFASRQKVQVVGHQSSRKTKIR